MWRRGAIVSETNSASLEVDGLGYVNWILYLLDNLFI